MRHRSFYVKSYAPNGTPDLLQALDMIENDGGTIVYIENIDPPKRNRAYGADEYHTHTIVWKK